MNDNFKIYVCCHKDFELNLKNKVYEPIISKNINNDTWVNGLKGSFYSEIMSYFYIAENYELLDYIGFCQYRRHWSFEDNVPNVEDMFKQAEVFVIRPFELEGNTYGQYDFYHNVEDLKIAADIVINKFLDYENALLSFLNGKYIFPYNMFIMKKEDFLRYINFIKTILDEYLNVVGLDIEKRIKDNEDKYFKHIEELPQNDTLEYQYRIGGYLAERLTNIFIIKNFNTIGAFDVNIIEEKYGFMA